MKNIEVAKNVIRQELEGVESLFAVIDEKFSNIIDKIYNITGRVILSGMGKSGHVARKIASTLASTGTPAFFIHPAEASHGDLGMITSNDIMILLSNSGETFELNSIIGYCKRFSIPIIGIARIPESYLVKISDISFILPDVREASSIDAPTTSSTQMVVLGDAIAIALQHKRNFTKDDFRILHPGGKIGAKLLKISNVMHRGEEVPVVYLNTIGTDVILCITAKRFGCAAVVDEHGILKGAITDGDLRRHIHEDFKKIYAADLMTTNPVTSDKEALAGYAISIMNNKGITSLFIVDDQNKPIGIVHMHDLLKAGVV